MNRSIPSRLNILLVLLVQLVMWGLLWLASQQTGELLFGCVVIFSFVFLTNFALMHEASHGNLHEIPTYNCYLGALTGLLFPTSATMMRVFHTAHHCCNRSDHEMFELYYPEDNRYLRSANWYAILLGLFWLIIPPAPFVVGFARPVLSGRLGRWTRNAHRLFDGFDSASLRQVRFEALLLLAVWVPLFWWHILDWQAVALCYAAAAWNWSSRQYVTHFGSPRDILDGAHNLATWWWMRLLLLNGNFDQAHHRYPCAPWTTLPQLAQQLRSPIPYWSQWLRQWRGIRRTEAPGPAPLTQLKCSRTEVS